MAARIENVLGAIMDDAARRLKKEWKRRQQAAARDAFPLDSPSLAALFDHVDAQLATQSCDHSLKTTRQWLDENVADPEPVLSWLREHGGYCDCEVVANAADHFESNRE
jgi:hypothetical protein